MLRRNIENETEIRVVLPTISMPSEPLLPGERLVLLPTQQQSETGRLNFQIISAGPGEQPLKRVSVPIPEDDLGTLILLMQAVETARELACSQNSTSLPTVLRAIGEASIKAAELQRTATDPVVLAVAAALNDLVLEIPLPTG
ncbi:MAG: hypothetical protein UX31_C0003G0053 [Candidatus Nomurabacteria bacterium GW2011_GWA1_46_11]|uniref:Uncharacterized protein n=1 Tax=Candidatus Nomurabacteria bacterium GW2011_GWA1_46_11 TaxID=1618732 RepID=A0A0G1NPY4_9BACT|nr:MAG: hypothetical protein UW69_C0072G0002 [Microgenomates group bacterium GW2011_GWA2_44_7]KKT78327.1 MAG: hypothetical protein UW73_C0004G0051 [Microgenomates group bacterium GW2011_GWB1_44_8]KKU22387.1 MAG: hypothetical protein UX31_C0003G0053 [Candidatus Nomurabacteria bacterium GW2011_GWA1_46_11]